ncbi:MAG TPA: hypothetical protein VFV94_07665 [Polyangiaceae bacterium]|jgi:hypothetical protein|nr:hypothetical protein [Polyangiaceae bacterium]
MVRLARYVGVLGLSLGADACEAHGCTEMGCMDSAGFTLHAPGDEWAPGAYELAIDFDETAHSCTFTMPDAVDAAGGQGVAIAVACTPKLDAWLNAVVTCTTHSDGSSSSQSCTPIPGRYYLSVQTSTLATSLSVSVTLDGADYFSATHALTYKASQPNGPDCEPICRNATVEFFADSPK